MKVACLALVLAVVAGAGGCKSKLQCPEGRHPDGVYCVKNP